MVPSHGHGEGPKHHPVGHVGDSQIKNECNSDARSDKRLSVAGSTTLLYRVPPVAVVIAFVWLGELPYPAELAGGVIVIAGVVIVSQGARLGPWIRGFVSTTRA